MKLTCRKNKGSILYVDPDTKRKIVDQLADNYVEVYRTKISKYLKDTYGITLREYYNIIVYGDSSYVNICKTAGCNKPTEFVNLSEGYREHCCNLCHLTDRNRRDWMNDSYRKRMTNVLNENNSLVKTTAEFEYSSFINKGENDFPSYFYIGITRDLSTIKFGVTRKGTYDRMYRNDLLTIHTIMISTAKNVAKLELELKYKLNSRKEWIDFSRIREVFKYIKEIRKTI